MIAAFSEGDAMVAEDTTVGIILIPLSSNLFLSFYSIVLIALDKDDFFLGSRQKACSLLLRVSLSPTTRTELNQNRTYGGRK